MPGSTLKCGEGLVPTRPGIGFGKKFNHVHLRQEAFYLMSALQSCRQMPSSDVPVHGADEAGVVLISTTVVFVQNFKGKRSILKKKIYHQKEK